MEAEIKKLQWQLQQQDKQQYPKVPALPPPPKADRVIPFGKPAGTATPSFTATPTTFPSQPT